MKALVFGSSRLIGAALVRVLDANGIETVSIPADHLRPGASMVDQGEVERVLAELQPDVIFLAEGLDDRAFCAVNPSAAEAANTARARQLASLVAGQSTMLVYYSSPAVFDAEEGPYTEDRALAPASVLGQTQAAGEQAIVQSTPNHLILRSASVFGWDPTIDNPGTRVWRTIGAGERLQAADDRFTNPTLVDYLAEVSLRLVQEGVRGIFNVAGHDRISEADLYRTLARSLALDPSLVGAVPPSDPSAAPGQTLVLGVGDVSPAQALREATVAREQTLVLERLEHELGTEPMSLEEMLKRLRRQWRAATYQGVGSGRAPSSEAEKLRAEILEKVTEYYELVHQPKPFTPFTGRVSYAGRVYGPEELRNAVDASLDFWLTLGPWGDLMEQRLRQFLSTRDVALVNSGSSANLTAVMTLMSPLIQRPLQRGDEVITPAVTFPTTLAPLVQNGLVPVFVDAELGTYNIDPNLIEAAISPRTRAFMLPHTLGNPFNLDVVLELARKHDLYLIEDSCDALGSEWNGQRVGTFGDLGTLSFYPAHHMTMGEGGAVIINQGRYARVARAVRDWGRDCWCAPGETNTCGRRFGWCLGELPVGYDHKYTYSQLGYNLKPTDLQAAIGVAQIERLPDFITARRSNFDYLYEGLREFEGDLILPRAEPQARPAWFGFPITVGERVSRRALIGWLEDSNIETREVFSGNILRQPGYTNLPHRVSGTLEQSDRVMRDTFFVGVYPGLTEDHRAFMVQRFRDFFAQRSRWA